MIDKEQIEPRKLGYDRPSVKFLNFLNKHYQLKEYVQQNNNFVVFKDYFNDEKKKDKRNYNNTYSNYNTYEGDYNRNYFNNYDSNINNNNKDNNNIYDNKENNYENNFRKLKRNDIPKKQSGIQKIMRRRENNNNNNNIDINIKDNNTEIGNQFSPQKKVNYQSSSSEYGAYYYMK